MQNKEAKQPNAQKGIITLVIIAVILIVVIGGITFLAMQLLGNLPMHTPRAH